MHDLLAPSWLFLFYLKKCLLVSIISGSSCQRYGLLAIIYLLLGPHDIPLLVRVPSPFRLLSKIRPRSAVYSVTALKKRF